MNRTLGTMAWTIFVIGCCGCADSDLSIEAQSPRGERPELFVPEVAPGDESPTDITGQISESDLGLGELPPRKPVAGKSATRILDESYEIAEHYNDESIKRRWTVRLYVTFERSKPWHQQSPGSWIEHGPYVEFYPGGEQRLMRGEFREGRRHGEWTFWHPGGEIARQGEYNKAQLEGAWRHYRADGTLLRTENYQGHQKHGVWRYYDSDGETVLREETYQRDERMVENVPLK